MRKVIKAVHGNIISFIYKHPKISALFVFGIFAVIAILGLIIILLTNFKMGYRDGKFYFDINSPEKVRRIK